MKLLLDTHIIIWAALRPQMIPPKIESLIRDPKNELAFSVVTLWEITVKNATKRPLPMNVGSLREGLLKTGYTELPITAAHVLAVGDLPLIHRDPFDRILIAQAQTEKLVLLTDDALIRRYPNLLFGLDQRES